jgi:hypothetical protein
MLITVLIIINVISKVMEKKNPEGGRERKSQLVGVEDDTEGC